jgi:hypothetical protein
MQRWKSQRLPLAIIAFSGLASFANLALQISLSDYSPSADVLFLLVFIFIGGLIPIILNEIRVHGENRRQIAELLADRNQLVLTDLLRFARRLVLDSAAATTRSSIFLYDDITRELYVYKHSGHFEDDEIDIRFGNNEGAVGFVFWYEGETTVFNLDGASYHELRQLLRLRPPHEAPTQRLKTILAAPIPFPGDEDRLIGVLAVDSSSPIEATGLDEQQIVDTLSNLAKTLIPQHIDPDRMRPIRRPGYGG